MQVGTLTNWSSLGCGRNNTAAIKTDGTLWTWGANWTGQLGDGTTTYRSSPVQVGALTTWSSVGLGANHCHAIKTDGTLWAWGRNQVSQLGLGNTTSYSSPVQVGALTGWLKIAGQYDGSLGIES